MRIAYILEQMTGGWLRYELDALCDLWAEIAIHPVNPAVYSTFEQNARYRKRTMIGDLGGAAATSLEHPAAAFPLFRRLSSAAGKKIAVAALSTAHRVGRERPAIMHAHFASTPAAAAWAVSRLTGVPFGFTAHAYDIYKEPIDWEFMALKCRDAAFVRCISEFNRRHLIRMTGVDEDKFRVIHCGVDARHFDFVPSKPQDDSGNSTILVVGNLVVQKGITYLLNALADASVKELGVRAVIVGGGPLRMELEQEARRLGVPAVFAGPVDFDEVRRYYDDADLFVLPCATARDGHHDGIPVVLMEAMACGVPVISTRLSGIPELVEDGKSGILVGEKDPRELAAAIRRLLVDADMRKRFSVEGRKKVVAQFEIRDIARQLMELFQACSVDRGNRSGRR